jgi:hypothetical protein
MLNLNFRLDPALSIARETELPLLVFERAFSTDISPADHGARCPLKKFIRMAGLQRAAINDFRANCIKLS